MKKLISKSASASRRTSSPSGTCAQTDATGKGSKPRKKTIAKKSISIQAQSAAPATVQVIAEKAKKMTPTEFRLSLVKAGIIRLNGRLTTKYAKVKKK